MKRPPLYSMRFAFQKICEGQGLWIALGNFLNAWFEDAKDRRCDLVAEPLEEAPEGEQYQRQAAYCAASIEHLCHKYGVPCPEWVHDPTYVLAEPWYDLPRPELLPRLQERLVATTPVEFRKRNIYSGDRMFDNKWELVEQYRERIEAFKRLSKKEQRRYYKTGKLPAR